MADAPKWTGKFDTALLGAWMDEKGLPKGEIENVQQLTGGTQNVLIRFERGGKAYVFRGPPPHVRANSNETMRREARLLGALKGSAVPHPDLIAAEPREDVIGCAFYLMQPIDGFNPRVGMPERHQTDAAWQHTMGLEMVDAIAALSKVDHIKAGLGDFGKTDGFLQRQVPRWKAWLDTYNEFEGWPGPSGIPGIEETGKWLDANIPKNFQPGIFHGDFHFGNVIFKNDSPRMAAVVDWELGTLGDPLVDLGNLLSGWPDDDVPAGATNSSMPWIGFPTRQELIDRYHQQTGRDMSEIDWFEVMACYKIGIILEGTYARACAGKAPKETGDMLHNNTVSLFTRALKRIG